MTGRRAIGFALAALATLASPSLYERAVFSPLPEDAQVDRIVVRKALRQLTVYRASAPLKTYRVALGAEPLGPKQFEGDRRTPEGSYTVDSRLPDSRFHMALHVSYPGAGETAAATAAGRDPGGAIMIHGLRNGFGLVGPLHTARDWTAGCVAVTNKEIEELWRVVPDGTPIEIQP